MSGLNQLPAAGDGKSMRAKSGELTDGHCSEDGYNSAEGDARGDGQAWKVEWSGIACGSTGNIHDTKGPQECSYVQ